MQWLESGYKGYHYSGRCHYYSPPAHVSGDPLEKLLSLCIDFAAMDCCNLKKFKVLNAWPGS